MPLSNIRVVLVNPLYGGNVGSVCRVMANTGLSDLVLVAPPALNMAEARLMACAASDILEGRRECPTFTDAVADCGIVAGSTARLGLYRSHSQTPREIAPRLLEAAANARVALVFGPENNGLSNDDLALCTHIIQIPSHPEYSSLNLSHAVLVCAYELFVAANVFEPSEEKSPEAPSVMRERMFAVWREAMLEIGFMKEDKAMHMMFGLRRILARGLLTKDDVRIMIGIARQMLWKARHAHGEAPEEP